MVTDYLAWGADEATMIAAFELLGVWRDGALVTTGRSATGATWAIDYFRDWLAPTGETTLGPGGELAPVLAAKPGVYALLRWLPADGEGPPPTPPGITLTTPLPDDCPRRWAN
ncbi:hypothetical protein EDE12_106132 [Methylosinus sp. sav-2]|uniref:hypothetical protein n=1 Tax=Methylosinus sp. sav-2 TaxID=2485168 RepID=UPI00047C04DE|nr:hypothetical protein [Methylosinus sp. sav-2]TDX63987.1 hypothetical protein EDE12_106132 [Methylosinus sp. sav-2]